MNNDEKMHLITALAADRPAYVPNYDDFVPGKSSVLYSGPYWDNRELEMAMKSLLLGSWLTTGEYTVRFQNKFASMFNVKHAHMVNSGSSANLIMLAAAKKRWGWEDGAEVIVSPVGFPTTIAPIVQNGLAPVFVDIELNTLNFDVSQIAAKITSKTVAILVSPVLGNPPDMDALKRLSILYGIRLLGDHCDSLGSRWNGKLLNEMYEAWSTSFFPAHHITTGEGGMVCSNDEQFIALAKSFTWWGRDCYCVGQANSLPCGTCKMRFSKWLENEGVDLVLDHKYVFTSMGYNLKPLDLQAAIGLAQLEKFEEIDEKRRAIKYKLVRKLAPLARVMRPATKLTHAQPCWFGVPIICDTPEIRASLVAHFEAHKIQTRSYFAGNILRHPAYKHLAPAADFPNADVALTRVFFIGCPPHYNDAVVNYIGEVAEKWRA
jgi:CDP-4-dehydro-6-deoxyglucose reductase, E1